MNKCRVFMLIAAINTIAVWIAAKYIRKKEQKLLYEHEFYR